MNDYKVTRFVTSAGYWIAIGVVALFALGGLAGMGFKGLFVGALVGALVAGPFMMFCEMMHAIVTIANNTKPEHKHEAKRDQHAA